MRPLYIAATTLSLACLSTAQIPCWESNFGVNLNLGDDSYSIGQPLGFNFAFGGATYTDIVVCSNGYAWLGFNAPPGIVPDYSPTVAELVSEGPRIAPLWSDFDPSAPGSGSVYFNSFPAAGGTPAYATVTWDSVFQYQQTTPLSMQLILVDGGDIYTHFDSNMSVVAGGFGSSPHVIGSSDGSGTQNPVSFTSLPILSLGNPTLHEVIPRGPFPLVGKDLYWMSDLTGGYIVSERTPCSAGSTVRYGTGCPKGATGYEYFELPGLFDLSNSSFLFQASGSGGFTVLPGPGLDTNYSSVLPLGDDDISFALPLGFSFPFVGITSSTIDVSANGIIWVGNSGYTSPLVNGYPAGGTTLVAEPVPVIAPLLMDLDPSAGGQVYFDTGASFAMVTWVNVPFFNVPGSANTLQAKMFLNGDVAISFGTANNEDAAIVGISEAGGASDPGELDWSNAIPTILGAPGTMALDLDAAAGSRPAINSTFTMDITNIPSGTSLGAVILSFTQTAVNAGIYGMPGCSQYVGLDATFLIVPTGATEQFGFMIPNDPYFLGSELFAQAATFSPGFNPLGIVSSNGLEIRVGL